MAKKKVFDFLKIALFSLTFLGVFKLANAGEFICEFYCDKGDSSLSQTKSEYPIRVKVRAPSAYDAEKYLLGGGWSYTRAGKICKEHGYEGGLYVPAFGSGVHCE